MMPRKKSSKPTQLRQRVRAAKPLTVEATIDMRLTNSVYAAMVTDARHAEIQSTVKERLGVTLLGVVMEESSPSNTIKTTYETLSGVPVPHTNGEERVIYCLVKQHDAATGDTVTVHSPYFHDTPDGRKAFSAWREKIKEVFHGSLIWVEKENDSDKDQKA